MLRLPPFKYLAPRSIDEAVDFIAHHPDARVVAGGTDLYPGMKRRIFEPKTLIGLRHLSEIQQIQTKIVNPSYGLEEGGVCIGAGVTLTQMTQHPILTKRYPALVRAALAISTPQLRNMGTIGGNLCLDTRCNYYNQSAEWRQAIGFCMKKDGHICRVAPTSSHCLAVQSADTVPVLMALKAKVRLLSIEGERWLPIHQFYKNDGIHYLSKKPNEILTDVWLPNSEGLYSSYQKLRRREAFDFPVFNVAVALRYDLQGICTEANIILGALASAPIRVKAAETALIGDKINHALIDQAAQLAIKAARPFDNTDMTTEYRRHMMNVYVKRALREALQLSTALP